jgi:hypothetical protein
MGSLAREYCLDTGGFSRISGVVREARRPRVAIHTRWDAKLVLQEMGLDVDYVSKTSPWGIPQCDCLVKCSNSPNPRITGGASGFG